MILYHYTTQSAFNEITRTKNIMPSDPLTTMDATYGMGWYFTDLAPTVCHAWKIAYCWRSLSEFVKVECYLKFDIPDGVYTYCGRDHVYMVRTWDNRIQYLEGNTTPKCSRGNCMLCHVISDVKKAFGWR